MSIAEEVAKMQLGIGKPRSRPSRPGEWTPAEDALMREHWPIGGAAAAHAALPARSRRAVVLRAQALRLRVATRYTTWTPERVAVLREHYPRIGSRGVSEMIGISKSAIQTKASVLGIVGSREAGQHVRREAARAKREAKLQERDQRAIRVSPEPGIRIAPPKWTGDPIITSDTKVTICPAGQDMRYRADNAPRVVDSAECRGWAAAL